MNAAGKGSPPTGDERTRGPQDIRTDIEETREELGETVAAVAEKTDVKKQAQAKGEELKESALGSATEGMQQAQRMAEENPVPLAIAGAFTAGLVVGRLLSR